ncbi:hypothetical protein J6590_084296 [Homalodisca vitripennis]|nr:hypothetical protein J6590_084296 [Homalodisca vitripennis]
MKSLRFPMKVEPTLGKANTDVTYIWATLWKCRRVITLSQVLGYWGGWSSLRVSSQDMRKCCREDSCPPPS